MDMEKDSIAIANIINEHYRANGSESVGVPVKSFEQKGFGHHDVRIALSILTKSGAVKSYHRCWGHTEVENGIAGYTEVSTEKPPQTQSKDEVEAYEAYHITIEPSVLKQLLPQPRSGGKPQKEGIIELALDSAGDLYKEPKDRYCYSMLRARKRIQLLRYLIEAAHTRKGFVRTEAIANALEREPHTVRTEVGKINSNALTWLKIGRRVRKGKKAVIVDGLIDSKQEDGYRINPRVRVAVKGTP